MAYALTDERRGGAKAGKVRALITITALGASIASAALIWQLWQPPVLGRATLPNGTRVILRGVTYGMTHRFVEAGPLPIWLSKHGAPISLPQAMEVLVRPSTLAWFNVRSDAVETMGLNGAGSFSVAHVLLDDEHGCRYLGNNLSLTYGTGDSPEQLIPVALPEQSAEGGTWTLRGFPIDYNSPSEPAFVSTQPAFEFEIRSAARSLAKSETLTLLPRLLPQTCATSRVRATLKSIHQQQLPSFPNWVANINAVGVRDPTERWEATSVVATDRWGNSGQSQEEAAIEMALTAGEGFAFYGLCRREPAWSLMVTLAPIPDIDRKPDYDWGKVRIKALREGSIPAGRTIVRESGGIRLDIEDEGMSYSDYYSANRRLLGVALNLGVDEGVHAVRVVAKSVNGAPLREFLQHAGVSFRDPKAGPQGFVDLKDHHGLYLPNPGNAKSMEIELVGYRAEAVTFVLDPSQPPPLGDVGARPG